MIVCEKTYETYSNELYENMRAKLQKQRWMQKTWTGGLLEGFFNVEGIFSP